MFNLVRRAAAQQFSGAGLSLSDLDRVLDSMYSGFPVWSGATVSQQAALTISTFWSCVAYISDDIATLPTLPYRRTFGKDGEPNGKKIAYDHYLYPLLMQQVNPELSSWRFFQLMQCWLMIWGNAVAEIVENGRGQVMQLWPWRWDRVKVTRVGEQESGPLQYQYHLRNGQWTQPVPAYRMLHLRGMGIDGVTGMDPVDLQKQTLGLNLGITEHGARYYKQGAKMGGIVQGPAGTKLNDKSFERLQKTLHDQHEGSIQAWRTLILEDGFTWKEAADNMINAAFIPSLTMTAQDIARFYKMPLTKLGLSPTAPASAAEELSLEYVLFTLSPWTANWQNQIHCDLLSSRENATIYTAFNYKNLLIGNHKDMATFISSLQDRGDLSADEVREMFLDLNAQPDGIGADYWKAVNMSPVGDEGKTSLTSPANVQQVQKVKKKQLPQGDPDDQPDDKDKGKTNGHASLHGMGLSDNLIMALTDFVIQQVGAQARERLN